MWHRPGCFEHFSGVCATPPSPFPAHQKLDASELLIFAIIPYRIAKKVPHSTGRECGSDGCPAHGKNFQGTQHWSTFEKIFGNFLKSWEHAKKSLFIDIRLKAIVILSKVGLLSWVCFGRVPQFLNSEKLQSQIWHRPGYLQHFSGGRAATPSLFPAHQKFGASMKLIHKPKPYGCRANQSSQKSVTFNRAGMWE